MRELELIKAQEPKRFTTKAGKSRFLGFSEESTIWKVHLCIYLCVFRDFVYKLKAENIQQVSNLSLSIPLDSVAQLGGAERGSYTRAQPAKGAKRPCQHIFYD